MAVSSLPDGSSKYSGSLAGPNALGPASYCIHTTRPCALGGQATLANAASGGAGINLAETNASSDGGPFVTSGMHAVAVEIQIVKTAIARKTATRLGLDLTPLRPSALANLSVVTVEIPTGTYPRKRIIRNPLS